MRICKFGPIKMPCGLRRRNSLKSPKPHSTLFATKNNVLDKPNALKWCKRICGEVLMPFWGKYLTFFGVFCRLGNYIQTCWEFFWVRTKHTGNMSYIHGTRIFALAWMHVKSMTHVGQRKKTSKLTLSGLVKSIAGVLKRRSRRLKHSVNTWYESTFSDADVVRELSRPRENFAIVPADNASNSYTFVCKRY